MKLLNSLSGKKTYVCCAALVLIGVATGLGIHVPDWVSYILAGGTAGAARLAIANNAKASTVALTALIDSVKTVASAPVADTSAPVDPPSA